MKVILNVLIKIRNRGDISDETLDYFLVNNPKLGRFYLLPEIHKRLHIVPGRPVFYYSSYFTENIYFFIYILNRWHKNVKSYNQDANDLLKKISNLPFSPDGLILCKIDVIGRYLNMLLQIL